VNFVSGALGSSGAITLNGGGLQWAGGNTQDISSRLAALGTEGGTFDTNGNDITLAGAIGGGALTKAGAGTLTLSGTNTYSGGTYINGGTLKMGSADALGSGSVMVTDGGTLDLNNQSYDLSRGLTGTGTVINSGAGGLIVPSGSVTFGSLGGAITSNLALTVGSTSTLTLYGNNSLTGGISLSGRLEIGESGAAGGSGNTITTSGSVISYANGADSGAAIQIASNTTQLEVLGTDSATQSGAISEDMAGRGFEKIGTGTLILGGANSYSGITTVSAGTLGLGSATAAGTGTIWLRDGTTLRNMVVTPTTFYNNTIRIDAGESATINGNTTAGAAFNGAITGGGDLVTTGWVALTSTTANSYGATTVSSGELRVGLGTAGTLGLGNVTNYGQLTFGRSDTVTVPNKISGTGELRQRTGGGVILTGNNDYSGITTIFIGATIQVGDGGTSGTLGTGDVSNSGSLIFDRADDIVVANDIGGIGSLTKRGAGILTLSGNSGFFGGITVEEGTLSLGSDSAAGTGTITTTGSVIDYADGVDIGNAIDINSNTTQLQVLTGTATQSGNIGETAGPRPLEKIGAGTLILSGINSYTGITTVSDGTLRLGSSSAISAAEAVVDGTLDLNGYDATLGNLSGSGTVDNMAAGAVTLTVGGDDQDRSFSGVLQSGGGALSLVKTGAGTLILANGAPNTFTGGVAINGGVLQAAYDDSMGDATGGLSFSNGGTLKLDGGFDTGRTVTLGAGGGQIDLNSGAMEMRGLVTGSGSLTVKGGGAFYLSGVANDYSGGTFVTDSYVMIDDDRGLGAVTGAVSLTDAALLFNADMTLASTRTITLDGAVGGLFFVTGETEIAGTITGSGTLHTTGGRLILSGSNDYSGGTDIQQGEVFITADANLGAAAGGVTMEEGYLTFGGGADLNAACSFALNGLGGVFDPNGYDVIIRGDISGTGDFVVLGNGHPPGSGSLTITADISHTGDTYIDGGILRLGNGGTTGSLQPGTVYDGGTLVFDHSGVFTFGSNITDYCGCTGGNVVKEGSGKVILAGLNDYTGTTTVNSGILWIDSAVALPTTTDVIVSAGGTLQLADNVNASVQSLSDGASGATPASVVIGTSSALTITDSASHTFSGDITGRGSLLFAGSGTQVLAGAGSDIGGDVAVGNASPGLTGALNITGSLNSVGTTFVLDGTLTVSAGGTLTSGSTAIVAGSGAATPSATVTGAGSTWNVAGGLLLGTPFFGTATGTLALPNTLILLASSAAVGWAQRGIERGGRARLALGLGLGALLGLAFLAVQVFEWAQKPYGLAASPYASLYFTITGFHMAHVAVGVAMLLALTWWSGTGYFNSRRFAHVHIGGLYWHFVDAVWLVIFVTFYLTPLLGLKS
jgi:autotransporter-associated beta strand protein